MEYSKVSEKFGQWGVYFKDFIESPAFDKIFAELKSRKSRGIKTYPEAKDVFRAFAITDPNNLKVVITGISPYHTETKEGVVIADGLALSCGKTGIAQPSLEQIWNDLENTYNDGKLNPDMKQEPDLSYLSAQGVLLYNVGLTVQSQKVCSDNNLWSEFNNYFWTQVINKYFKGLVCVFMGVESHKSAKLLAPMLHYDFCISHPASASYAGGIWCSDKVWLKIDRLLEDNYKTKVRWFLNRHENLPEWVTKAQGK